MKSKGSENMTKIRNIAFIIILVSFLFVGCGEKRNLELDKEEVNNIEEQKEEVIIEEIEKPIEVKEEVKEEITKEQVVDFISLKLKTPISWDATIVSVFDGIPYTYECTYYYDGDNLRMDIWGPSGEQRFIQNESTNEAYLLDIVRNKALKIEGESIIQGMYFFKELYLLEIDPNSENAEVKHTNRNGNELFDIIYKGDVGEDITALIEIETGLPHRYTLSYYGTPQVEVETSNIKLVENFEEGFFELSDEMKIVDIEKWTEEE